MATSGKTAVVGAFLTLIVSACLAADPVTWRFKTGGAVRATPVLLDDVVYLGSLDSVFYAIDAGTGMERWRYRTPNPIFTTAAVDGDILCFESGNSLFGMTLQGEWKWEVRLTEAAVVNQHDEWDYFHSSPLAVDGIAYVGTVDGGLVGVDMATGAVVFRAQTQSRSSVKTRPAVFNGRVYFGNWDGVFYSYDLGTGALSWQYDTRNDKTYGWVNAIVTDPVVWNGSVYFAGRSCFLYSLNPETGALNWRFHDPNDMWLLGGPTLSEGMLFIGSSLQNFVQAFDPSTGAKCWLQGVDYRVNGAPLVDGDCVFFGTEHITENLGSLYALDRLTGKPLNRLPMDGPVYSSPVCDKGTLYFGSENGWVYAVDRKAFLENPLPETGFRDRSKLQLGSIPADRNPFEAGLTVYNTGDGSDSVTVTFIRPAALAPEGILNVEPARFALAPGDSQVLAITIDPSRIKPNKYNLSVQAASDCNLEQRTVVKSVAFTVEAASGAEGDGEDSPSSFSLEPNYPNPFNPRTTLCFSLPRASRVRFDLFDRTGRRIRTLAEGILGAGRHSVEWNGLDDHEVPVGTGTYLCRLTMASAFGSQTLTRKMALMK